MARARARRAPAGEPDEAEFGTVVENLLDLYGWRWYHAPDNRPVTARSGKRYVQRVRAGFLDYIALRGPELLVIELKSARGRLGPGQAEWLEAWRDFGRYIAAVGEAAGAAPAPRVDVVLWRPADLDDIHTRLSRGRHRLEPVNNPC